MKILLVGSGGREHALAKLLFNSALKPRLFVLADYVNPGLKREAEASGGKLYTGDTVNPLEVARIADLVSPDIIVVGPEEPQFTGVVDLLREKGYSVFGALSKTSMIERSKVFARTLMWKHSIPGRLYFKAFKNLEEAYEYLKHAGDVVLKPARQAGGKGVRVIRDTRAYLTSDKTDVKIQAASKIFDELSRYQDIEYKIIIEQRVEGVEYTAQVITDGSSILPLPLVQDNPHAFEGDLGPETGGMGGISGPGFLLPFITSDEFNTTIDIIQKVLRALEVEVGEKYTGVIAGQMMLTPIQGPTVIEFYSRFGDPEIGCLIPRIESDFLEIIERTVSGRLAGAKLEVKDNVVSIVKAVAPVGYPSSRKEALGHPVSINEKAINELKCIVLYASVEEVGSVLYTKGSRVFEIVCYGENYNEVYKRSLIALTHIESLDGWPLFYRRDIGSPEQINERIKLAEKARQTYTYRASRGLVNESIVWIPGKGVVENMLFSTLTSSRGGFE